MEEEWAIPPRINAVKIRLRDILKPRKTRINYLYDMEDSWEHLLVIAKLRPGEPGVSYPRYVAGALAAPPEDCGGIPGLYNPKEIDELPLKIPLSRIANGRNAARERLAKPNP